MRRQSCRDLIYRKRKRNNEKNNVFWSKGSEARRNVTCGWGISRALPFDWEVRTESPPQQYWVQPCQLPTCQCISISYTCHCFARWHWIKLTKFRCPDIFHVLWLSLVDHTWPLHDVIQLYYIMGFVLMVSGVPRTLYIVGS